VIPLRRVRRGDDQGFALIFVLFVTTMIMIAVGTTLAQTAPNITTAKRSQDSAGALLAAQSGVDDAIAYLTNVPACRSETRICPQALGASSANLVGTSYQRPTLGTAQSFSWTTAPAATADGYVRVTSIGTEAGTKRTLVADLSLSPSILAYGYYTDYESQSPNFFNNYYTPRKIDITDATTYGNVNTVSTTNTSVPQVASWNGASTSSSTGFPDSVCGQHYYSDGTSSPGRYSAGSTWKESGTIISKATSHSGSCDLVFTTGMVENGPTYTRDALLISDAGGSGPVFQQPVYTLWGYTGHTTPTPKAGQYYRQNATGDTPSSSGYAPAIATSDITLPSSIGTDGIENNSCIYYGPTRVKLNGDGTATVTSPATTQALAGAAVANGADSACYPTGLGAAGIVGYALNYQTTGSGTIYVKNLNKPSGGWPTSSLTSTSAVSPSTEVLYIPPTTGGATSPDQSGGSAAADGCTSSVTYSANNSAACAWSSVSTATDAGPYSGYQWTSYSAAKCNAAADTNRQLFECEYGNLAGTAAPAVTQAGGAYKKVRTAFQTDLAKGTCTTGAVATDQLSCLTNLLNNELTPADTTAHRYIVGASAVGTPVAGTTQNVGAAPTNPDASDPLFTNVPGVPAQETLTKTPISLGVIRQTFANGTWTNGDYQFAVTVTQSTWSISQAATGGQSYFPSTQDVTTYATGATSAGVAAGSTGTAQPGDLYVDGVNSGSLSLIADNNVELTGNVTKGSGNDSSAANPVSITAGNDVRNYHPVSCVDQTAADINATTAGFCPNDLTGLTTNSLISGSGTSATFAAQHPAAQYSNMTGSGAHTIDAAVFTLTGSLRTDNYDRGAFVGNLTINGGIYQSHRGANGVQYSGSNNAVVRSGANLIYNYVDLQRAHLPYAPAASYSNNPRVWNVTSLSAGSS
jgi:hypothetical protein